MWKLRICEGGGLSLMSVNNYVGREYWEFDPNAGTFEDKAEVERYREEFRRSRFKTKQSADLLMQMELRKENPRIQIPPPVKVKDMIDVTEETVAITLRRGLGFLSSIQTHDGHWAGDLGGMMFTMPHFVIVLYITGSLHSVLSSEHQKEIRRHTYNHQNTDGGWGLHIEGQSSMFGSVLNYVTLRLLGEELEEMAVARGQKWILDHGGATLIPSWGKFILSVLGAYEWSGCNPMPPEFWLVPSFSPFHSGKMSSLSRLIYMPMSYLYGRRFVGEISSLIQSLRQEIYIEPYHQINWQKTRNMCAKEDLYYPHPLVQDMLWEFLYKVGEPLFSSWPFSILREKALKVAMEHIHYEDENSRYLCIAAGQKVLCLLSCWVEDPNSEAYRFHLARVKDYLWIAEDGLKIQGTPSQTWITSFAIQAIISCGFNEEYRHSLLKAHDFIKNSQVQRNPSGDFTKMYRHISKGAWVFSTPDNGWQVSDCTAEALKAALMLSKIPSEIVGRKLDTTCLYNAVDVILSFQSNNGGFSAWEPVRSSRWFEMFNPAEFIEDALIEREYVECTSSAIQALTQFKELYPEYRPKDVETCIGKALDYIQITQNPDGSWYGCWGICFTYGTWFGVEGLVTCGKNYNNCPSIRKACDFLLSKQLPDGGWGESYLSSQNKVYTNIENNRSNLVQTAWALLALMKAGQAERDATPLLRGIMLLINAQNEIGGFPQQEITGVFMRNCVLNYSLFKDIFPIWALGEYHKHIRFA
ncbi:lupeol synthase-like [Castanea sativa]|uniref:lupeol synthase-like n=1 Tax=Castanea sativa TaxID=21020 RepID=UPI003F6527D4